MLVDSYKDTIIYNGTRFLPSGSFWAHGEFAVFMEHSSIDYLDCYTIEGFKYLFLKSLGINVSNLSVLDKIYKFSVPKMESEVVEDARDIIKATMANFNQHASFNSNEYHSASDMKDRFLSILQEHINYFGDGITSPEEDEVIEAILNSFDALEKCIIEYKDNFKYKFDLHTGQFLRSDDGILYCSDIVIEMPN